eukprot:COSAG04_NODE_1939_length_5175_cov_5.418046_7_plen_151_part_00
MEWPLPQGPPLPNPPGDYSLPNLLETARQDRGGGQGPVISAHGAFPSSERVIKICYKKKKVNDVVTITETDLLQMPKNEKLPGPYTKEKTVAFMRMMYGKSPHCTNPALYTRFEQCIVDLRSTLTDEQRGDLPRDKLPVVSKDAPTTVRC